MAAFSSWAARISQGDLWSKDVPYPMHTWHAQVAADFRRVSGVSTPNRELWEDWVGGGRFYQDPLYAYVLAAAGGGRLRPAQLLQGLMGVSIVLLLASIGRHAFGSRVGVIAGLTGLLYGPLYHYELFLLRATTVTVTGLLLVRLLLQARDRDRELIWTASGAVAGLAFCLKASFLLMIPVVLALAARPRSRRILGGTVLGILLGLSPLLVRNAVVGVRPWQTASAGPVNFVLTNSPGAGFENGFVDPAAVGPTLAEVGGSSWGLAPTVIGRHDGLLAWLGLLGRKLLTTLHWYEIPNNTNFYLNLHFVPLLRLFPLSFGVLAALGLVGLFLTQPRRWPELYGLLALHALALTVFFVHSRHRLPLAAALIPFAALALDRALSALNRPRSLLPLVGTVTLVAAGLFRPLPEGHDPIRYVDYAQLQQHHYQPRMRAAAQAGDWNEAASVLASALSSEPDWVKTLDRTPRNAERRRTVELFADLRAQHSIALREAGRLEDADAELRRATILRSFLTGPSGRDSETR